MISMILVNLKLIFCLTISSLGIQAKKKKKSRDNRFLMSGFIPDKEIVVLSDTRKEFDLESIYKQITYGFSL